MLNKQVKKPKMEGRNQEETYFLGRWVLVQQSHPLPQYETPRANKTLKMQGCSPWSSKERYFLPVTQFWMSYKPQGRGPPSPSAPGARPHRLVHCSTPIHPEVQEVCFPSGYRQGRLPTSGTFSPAHFPMLFLFYYNWDYNITLTRSYPVHL